MTIDSKEVHERWMQDPVYREAYDAAEGKHLPSRSALRRENDRLKEQLAEARETNKRLNRRVQEAESGALKDPYVKEHWRLKNDNAWTTQWAVSSNERVGKTFSTFKRIYEAAAKALDLPCGKYHSVMDWAFKDNVYRFRVTDHEPGTVYANVFTGTDHGVISYEVAEVVEEAIATLQGNLDAAHHEIELLKAERDNVVFACTCDGA